MELEGEAPVDGRWLDRVVGLNDVRADIAMMRTPDGHSRPELTKFHTPPAVRSEPEIAPGCASGVALRASSSGWPSGSTETSKGAAGGGTPGSESIIECPVRQGRLHS
jgi:hypothetical protein